MTDSDTKKLCRASNTATSKQVQHVLLTVSEGGKFNVSGAENLVTPLLANEQLYNQLKDTMLENHTEGEVVQANTYQLVYPLLPCSPFSGEWKGSAMVRKVLRMMLNTIGYGKSGRARKFGVGDPPMGWPEDISWPDFSGSTSSKLTIQQITSIIVSMLQAAGIDPNTHIVPPTEEEEDMVVVNPVTGEVERLVEVENDATIEETDEYEIMDINMNRNVGS